MLKRILICGLSALAVSAFSPSNASAGPNANAKILLHLVAPTTKNACTRPLATPDCAGIVTAGGLFPQTYFAYLLVTDADSAAGVAGLQCGITYSQGLGVGVDIYSWTNCATLEFSSGGWPAAGSGNLITWDSTSRCQRSEPGGPGTGVVAAAGYFYCAAYGSDTLRVTVRDVDGTARVASCEAKEDVVELALQPRDPSPLGFAVFSSSGELAGYSPCGADESGGLIPAPANETVGDSGVTTFVQLNTTAETFVPTVKALRDTFDIKVLVALSPDGMICQLPDSTYGAVVQRNSHVVATSRGAIKGAHAPPGRTGNAINISAVDVWNEMLSQKAHSKEIVAGATTSGVRCGGTINKLHRSDADSVNTKPGGGSLESQGSLDLNPLHHTADYLMGDIGVSAILAESNATGPCPSEDWTTTRIITALAEVDEGLTRLCLWAPPEAGLCFFVDLNAIGHTAQEPVEHTPDDSDGWTGDVFSDIGWGRDPAQDINHRRSLYGYDWYMAVLVVSALCPEHRTFGNTGAIGFANAINGMYAVGLMVGPYATDIDMTISHEVCHVFGAADEYGGAPTCNDLSSCAPQYGYMHVINGNCAACSGAPGLTCLMGGSPYSEDGICSFTKGQIGWTNVDSDLGLSENDFLDPVDHPYSGKRMLISDNSFRAGDVVDIYSKLGVMPFSFLKRIAITERNLDNYSIAWDGIDCQGDPISMVPLNTFWYRINGGPYIFTTGLATDLVAPTRNAPSYVVLHMPPETANEQGPHELKVSFTDTDTKGGIVLAQLSQVGVDGSILQIAANDFVRDSITQTWHTWSFMIPNNTGNLFILRVAVTDVGGRHLLTDGFSFHVSGVDEPVSGPTREQLSVRTVSANPSNGGAQIEINSDKSRGVLVCVFDVRGRLVHRIPIGKGEAGRTFVVWNGRTAEDGAVASGKYYVQVVAEGGATASSQVVIVR